MYRHQVSLAPEGIISFCLLSLGVRDHDGDGNAVNCPTEDQYVMAARALQLNNTNFNNTFRFSSCSIQELENYLTNRLVNTYLYVYYVYYVVPI